MTPFRLQLSHRNPSITRHVLTCGDAASEQYLVGLVSTTALSQLLSCMSPTVECRAHGPLSAGMLTFQLHSVVQARLTELEAEGGDAAAALDAAEEQLAEAQRGRSDAFAKLEDAEGQLAEARSDVEAAKTRIAELERVVEHLDSSADADQIQRWALLPARLRSCWYSRKQGSCELASVRRKNSACYQEKCKASAKASIDTPTDMQGRSPGEAARGARSCRGGGTGGH